MIKKLLCVLLLTGCGAVANPFARSVPPGLRAADAADPVKAEADRIEQRILDCEARWTQARDKRAIFATAYRISTKNIRAAEAAGKFLDPGQVEKAVVQFGRLYFEAVDADEAGQVSKVPMAWQRAFARAHDAHSNVATNLVLSMNAHIIRDLPFAAASLGPMSDAWHTDYLRLNDVLSAEVAEIRTAEVSRYAAWDGTSPYRLEARLDDAIAGRIVTLARGISWKHALAIAADPARGGADNEAYSARLASFLDHDNVMDLLWLWLDRTTTGQPV
jgi:hypothetical protein